MRYLNKTINIVKFYDSIDRVQYVHEILKKCYLFLPFLDISCQFENEVWSH